MSDGIGRPLFAPSPIQNEVGFQLNGSPVHIITQFPDCLPGNTPVMFANLQQLYILVVRQNTTLQVDPFSAGFCTLFKFSARIGGGIACPSAGRLLRVK
jgi:HK97 family phage major capsid protein